MDVREKIKGPHAFAPLQGSPAEETPVDESVGHRFLAFSRSSHRRRTRDGRNPTPKTAGSVEHDGLVY